MSKKRKEVVKSIEEAAGLIKDGQIVAIGGFGVRTSAPASSRSPSRNRCDFVGPSWKLKESPAAGKVTRWFTMTRRECR